MVPALIVAAVILAILLVWWLTAGQATRPCPAWLAWMVELENPIFRNQRSAAIIAGLAVEPGMHVLDVGCGPGRLTMPLARAVGPTGEVVAVDVQEAMLARAAQRVKAAQLENVLFVRAKVGEGSLAVGAFDRAVLVAVLGEIPDRQAAMKEIFAALKPGGVLAVAEVIADPHFQRRANVMDLAQAAGFRLKHAHGGRIAYVLYLEK